MTIRIGLLENNTAARKWRFSGDKWTWTGIAAAGSGQESTLAHICAEWEAALCSQEKCKLGDLYRSKWGIAYGAGCVRQSRCVYIALRFRTARWWRVFCVWVSAGNGKPFIVSNKTFILLYHLLYCILGTYACCFSPLWLYFVCRTLNWEYY